MRILCVRAEWGPVGEEMAVFAAHHIGSTPRQGRERRIEQRQRLMIASTAHLGPWRERASCIIRDLTPSGARIKLVDGYPADIWELDLDTHGELRKARIVWRNAQEIGMTFNLAPDLVDQQVEALKAILRQRTGLAG